MTISVYLSKEVHDKLCEYGNLSYVANKLLTDIMAAGYDYCNKPACPGRENCSRYNINVDNDDYIETLLNNPTNSPICSLRRILYWFVNEKMYDELGWEVNEHAIKHMQVATRKLVNDAVHALAKCVKQCPNDEELNECYEYLKEIYKKYDNDSTQV